jgi:hypothetical protein
MSQGKKNIRSYVMDFQEQLLLSNSNLDEDTKMMIFRKGLSYKLQDKLIGLVRVRWVDHKCKVNSDEFDREATLCSWWVYICPVVLSSRSFQQFLERRRSSESSTEGPHSNEGLGLS